MTSLRLLALDERGCGNYIILNLHMLIYHTITYPMKYLVFS